MEKQFWEWLNRYRSVDSLKKLTVLKAKYLNDNNNTKYIHISGTNGKGSVARYLHRILITGLKVKTGMFTSPHILAINERIVINDQMIADEDLLRIKDLIAHDVDYYQLGFFAVLTLIALIYFQEQKVEWAIIEVGIGGLSDATNIIKSDYCVISSIAKDHTEVLGNSLKAILHQKLGIVKKSTKILFVSGNIAQSLKAEINKTINDTAVIFSNKLVNASYLYQNQDLAKTIINHLFPNFNHELMIEIIRATKIKLRYERFNFSNKILYFDVAHNLAGINALIKILKKEKIKIDKIIFSALNNKNPEILIKKLKQITNNLLICQNIHPNSMLGAKFNFHDMILNDNVNKHILVTGSCYFAAEIYNKLLRAMDVIGAD